MPQNDPESFSPPKPLIALDTNVLISGATIAKNPPGQILTAWQNEAIDFALSEPILAEIKDVLNKPYFREKAGWTKEKVDKYLRQLRLASFVVPGKTPVNVCRDPKDNMIFSCAIESGADYIVSGDKDVLAVGEFKNIPVLTPRGFVEKVPTT